MGLNFSLGKLFEGKLNLKGNWFGTLMIIHRGNDN